MSKRAPRTVSMTPIVALAAILVPGEGNGDMFHLPPMQMKHVPVSFVPISSGRLLPVQTPPSAAEVGAYEGLHAAVIEGDLNRVQRLLTGTVDVNVRDPHGRTPLMLAAYRRDVRTARELLAAGADVNALDTDRYDVLTIAAVADDLAMVELALEAGANPGQITSPYDGTALIAAAHLGHDAVVAALVRGGAPVDHVNNLAWTALIEAIVLGDGGARHQRTVTILIEGGADVNLPDGNGASPLSLARQRGYAEIAALLEAAGARP